ncbi:SpaA isopeptide-forming pilin-related protein [Companilactobacillus suantsaicola]|nr:SpaA isopeptide-forming pilin-related protein [Companilactobacillus suantsaicola]
MKKSCLYLSLVGLVLALFLFFMPSGSIQAASTTGSTSIITTTTTPRAIDGITGLSSEDATVTDMNGNPISPTDNLYSWLNFNVNYNWSIPDNIQINDGDTNDFELPNGLVANGDLSFPIYNSSGTVIGTGTIKNGSSTGTITFNSALSNTTYNRKGTLHLIAKGTESNTANEGQNWMFNKVGWVAGYDQNGIPNELTWNIAFNPNEHDLTGVVITDTLGPNQTYVPDSLNAIGGSYQSGGFVSNGTQLHPTVTTSGNQVIITFPGTVSTAVDIYYRVKVSPNADGTTTWSNNATMASSEGSYNVGAQTSWGGSGTGDGSEVGSIVFKKTDSVTGAALPGAEYKLVDSTGNVLMTNVTTDSTGTINIKNLPLGTYTLTEVKAPEGYMLNPDPITFTVPDNGNLNLSLSQTDEPIGKGNVVLTKSDSTVNKLLPGAVFNLLDGEGNIVQSDLTTDENGQIALTDLPVGSYSFVETKAPEGYELNSEPIKFEITLNNTTDVSAEDTPISEEPGTVTPPDIVPSEPENPGTNPEEPGTTEPPVTNPENPGTSPEEPGTTEPPVTNPENPGTSPEEPGTIEPPVTNPENPGNQEAPQEPEPEIPGTTNPVTPSEPEKPGTTNPVIPSEPEVPSVTNPVAPVKPEIPGTKPVIPEFPGVTVPSTSTSSTTPSTTTSSSNVGTNTSSATSQNTSSKKTFPQTGNASGLMLILMGLLIFMFLIIKRIIKRTN